MGVPVLDEAAAFYDWRFHRTPTGAAAMGGLLNQALLVAPASLSRIGVLFGASITAKYFVPDPRSLSLRWDVQPPSDNADWWRREYWKKVLAQLLDQAEILDMESAGQGIPC